MAHNLQDHYENKYSSEAKGHNVREIVPVSQPGDRFEAAVTLFPKHFQGGSVLELGAGDGAVAKALLGLNIGILDYTVGDLSLARVSGIKENITDARLSVCQIDAEHIDEGESRLYDAIIMIALIEHLIDPMKAMSRLRKLLKPGGIVYIDTPNFAKYTRRIQLALGCFPSTASKNEGLLTYAGQPTDLYDEGHLHYFTYGSLTRMLVDRCGFSRVDKLSYPCGNIYFGKKLEGWLARVWPEAFSELVVVAHN